jgi:hypothetical protein
LIAKNLLTGSLKNRSTDNLETQKKYISMKNSQFFADLLWRSFYLRRSSIGSFVERDFFIRILLKVYFDFADSK